MTSRSRPKSRVARPVARFTAATCSLKAWRRATNSSNCAIEFSQCRSQFVQIHIKECPYSFYRHGYHSRMSSSKKTFWTGNPAGSAAGQSARDRCRNGWPRRSAMPRSPIPTPWSWRPSTAAAIRPPAWCCARKSQRNSGYILFYTNYRSRKGASLTAQPARRRGLSLGSSATGRSAPKAQVEPLSDAENDAYFRTRAWQSQLGAWASQQSQPVESREALAAAVAREARRFGIPYEGPGSPEPENISVQVPRPPNWGGYPPRMPMPWNCGSKANIAFMTARAGHGPWTLGPVLTQAGR